MPIPFTMLPAASAQIQYCRQAEQTYMLNIPGVRNDDPNPHHETEIIHSSVVYVNAAFAAFIYQTRNGKTWVHIGPLAAKNTMPSITAIAATALGVPNKPGLAPLSPRVVPMGSISIESCY